MLTKRPHQEDAVKASINAFQTKDRATLVMACGTGKSLIGMWVAEEIQGNNVIVFVPSLALMSQIVQNYKDSWNGKFNYLCVCSDKTVDEDDISEVSGISVTNDIRTVVAFLNSELNNKKFIFTTYHSAKIVATAMREGFEFDLGIFDEAHKTAGHVDKMFSFALNKDNMKIRKRLFMTATPRHSSFKAKTRGDIEIYSMENEKIYGKIVYQISFSEAVKRELIVNYKVLICAVTNKEVDKEMIGKNISSNHAVGLVALNKCYKKYHTRKVIAFMNTVQDALDFSNQKLSGFEMLHVNGGMKSEHREKIINDFSLNKNSVITNARCLTEGVDVPAVDMVAFFTPKKSDVDIIQATGRAMRNFPGKKIGYILIPVLIDEESEKNIEDIMLKADYQIVWDVLRKLQENDDSLNYTIQKLANSYGEHKDFEEKDSSGLFEKIDFVDIKIDSRNFDIICVDKLGYTWDENFGKYKRYMNNPEANKDVRVEIKHWIEANRKAFKDKTLSRERYDQLRSVGFDFITILPIDDKIKKLTNYINKHHVYPTSGPLGLFVRKVRNNKYAGITEEHKKQLNEINFPWKIDRGNDYKFSEFAKYVKENRKGNYFKIDESVYNWILYMRDKNKEGSIDTKLIKKFEKLGYDLSKTFVDNGLIVISNKFKTKKMD